MRRRASTGRACRLSTRACYAGTKRSSGSVVRPASATVRWPVAASRWIWSRDCSPRASLTCAACAGRAAAVSTSRCRLTRAQAGSMDSDSEADGWAARTASSCMGLPRRRGRTARANHQAMTTD
eukprot:scaffold128310_cov60-Phaeocystis_antarctica.AAC.1